MWHSRQRQQVLKKWACILKNLAREILLSSAEIIKRLKELGWYHVKTVGDHHQFKHPTRPGKVTIPHPNKDLAIGTLKAIEKQSGIKLR